MSSSADKVEVTSLAKLREEALKLIGICVSHVGSISTPSADHFRDTNPISVRIIIANTTKLANDDPDFDDPSLPVHFDLKGFRISDRAFLLSHVKQITYLKPDSWRALFSFAAQMFHNHPVVVRNGYYAGYTLKPLSRSTTEPDGSCLVALLEPVTTDPADDTLRSDHLDSHTLAAFLRAQVIRNKVIVTCSCQSNNVLDSLETQYSDYVELCPSWCTTNAGECAERSDLLKWLDSRAQRTSSPVTM